MKTIEEIKVQHAKELKAAELRLKRAENFETLGLPIPGYFADGRTHGAVGVSFFDPSNLNRKMGDAVQMFRAFAEAKTISPFAVMRDGTFTTMVPEKHIPQKKHGNPWERDTGRHSSDYAVKMRVTHNGENANTSATLEFFAVVAGELFNVSICFGSGYIGNCQALAPKKVETRGYGNRIVSASYSANEEAHAVADSFISYGYGGDTGPIKTGADHCYIFVSDTEGDGAECSHAIAMLENLADAIGEGI